MFKKYSKKVRYIDFKHIFKIICGILIKRRIIINGLNSGEIIERLINKACSEKGVYNIGEIEIPLLIPSVELHTGSIYCFSSKMSRRHISDRIIYINNINIGRAVRASCSYPVIFSPCPYLGLELIDGGIRENIPWKETKHLGADKVISVVFEQELSDDCCNNIIDVVSNSMNILTHELSDYETNGTDLLLKIKTKEISLLDMKRIDELFELGYRAAKKNMTKIKSML